ncbi:hypothetical protein [Dyadobacter luticola]|uniref:Uncharacterized protein n=1 Tax=Dyadobacter luticola TaxID=1979387 RepID=A0A5R9L2C4_9BACT|nr:hypothetical protein [Dyadobacter luticola]TLV02683.1 hypothetical protein FEN17_03430 [Dyadobacter luticola]
MTFIKLLFLFILITLMQHHGIINRTGKKEGASLKNRVLPDSNLSGQKLVEGTWRLVGVSKDESALIFPYRDRERAGSGDSKEMLFSFFQDSTFTQIGTKGEYVPGRWAFDDKTQSVFFTQGRNTQEIPLSFDKAANGMRFMSIELNNLQVLSLAENGKPVLKYEDDPFYYTQNKWRTKPTQPESKKQIKLRLLNYILHTAQVLKAAQIRKQRQVSLEFSQGIIQLYNVGIGIVKKDKIPATWVDSFYSHEDAMKAYDIFEDYLITARHKKFNTGKWVQDDYNILIDIHNGLIKRK